MRYLKVPYVYVLFQLNHKLHECNSLLDSTEHMLVVDGKFALIFYIIKIISYPITQDIPHLKLIVQKHRMTPKRMVISFSVKGKPNYLQYYRVWEYNRQCILYIAIPLSLSGKWHWSTWIETETVKKVIVTNVLTPAFWDKLRRHVCKSTIDDGVGMTQRVTIMNLMGYLIIRYHLCRKAYKKCTF